MANDSWPFRARPQVCTGLKKPRKQRSDAGTKRAAPPPRTRLETIKLADDYELMFCVSTISGSVENNVANLYAPRDRHWHGLALEWFDPVEHTPTIAGLYLVAREKHTSTDTEYVMAYYCTERKTWFERTTSGERWFTIARMRLFADNYLYAGIPPQLAQHLGLDKTA